MAEVGKGLLAVLTDAQDGAEPDLIKWYDEDHLAERSAVEGFINSRRYVSLEGQPKFLALYELENTGVLHGAAYEAAREREARAAQLPYVINGIRLMKSPSRAELELLAMAGEKPAEVAPVVKLLRFESAFGDDAGLAEYYKNEHLPSVANVPGVDGVKLYEASAGKPRYFIIYELASQDVLSSDAWKQATAGQPELANVSENVGQLVNTVFPEEAKRMVNAMPKYVELGITV